MKATVTAALALLGTMMAGSAMAQTMSYAQAGQLLAKSCGPDIERFCRNDNIGNGVIFACLIKNQAEVKQQCFTDVGVVQASLAKRIAAQRDAWKVCESDVREFCKGVVPGDANILNCLTEASKVVSPACTAVLTDAGWR